MAYLDLVNSFVYRDPHFRAKYDAMAENDDYLKAHGWANSTKAIFFQAAAPTGWTKDTTNNGKILRVVSGVSGGSVGGSADISSAITLQHTAHSITAENTHTHAPQSHSHGLTSVSTTTGKTSFQSYLGGTGDTPVRTYSNGPAPVSSQPRLDPFVDFDPNTDEYDASSAGGAHDHGLATQTSALTDTTFKYVNVLVCSKDSSSGYTDMTAEFDAGDEITYQDLTSLAENDEFLYLRLTPSGTISAFGQASAPTGWTKETANDDAALRVVSGTGGGTGGSTGFGSSVNLTHSHTTSSDGAHTHTLGAHRHRIREGSNVTMNTSPTGHVSYDGSGNLFGTTDAGGTLTCVRGRTDKDGGGGTLTSDGTHTHTIGGSLSTLQMAYIDVILCSKNSSGASTVYTDMTAVWVFEVLVSKQRLNKMGANDDYIKYHTIEAGSKAFFSQVSAPLNWTKLTTQNDKGLRVVSGSSGGSTGGSQAISSAIVLAHTHSIANASHYHAGPSHTHSLATYSESNAGSLRNPVALNASVSMEEQSGSSRTIFPINRTSTSSNPNSNENTHNHGAVTGSLLSNVTLAYQDVIYCQKD